MPGHGNANALRHGARSERVIRPLATRHARRLLRQRGLGATDLSAIGRGLLHNWARAAAALELLEEHAATVGLLDDDGNPRSFTGLYTRLLESERKALRDMESHLHAGDRGPDPIGVLIEQGRAIRVARDERESNGG